MTPLKVQEFLREFGLAELQSRYNIVAKRHAEYPNIVLLKYSMVDSPMGEPLVQECRGLLLDESKDWAVICHTFDKFWNAHEGYAAKIDWNTAKVLEKCDGSLAQVWYNPYSHAWEMSTSGTPDGKAPVNDSPMSFRDLFWRVWKDLGYPEPNVLNKDRCYAFELMTPYNRVVVPYPKNRITLLAVRNLNTGNEEDPLLYWRRFAFDKPKSYAFSNTESVKAFADTLSYDDGEGFVVVDGDYNRIKIKGESYLRAHYLKSTVSASIKNVVEYVAKGETSEILAYFPDMKPTVDDINARIDALVAKAEATYEENKGLEVQKDFALKVKDLPYSGIMFSLRSGRLKTVRQGVAAMDPKMLMGILKIDYDTYSLLGAGEEA